MMNARELEKWLRCPYCRCVDVEVRPARHGGSMFVLECQQCDSNLEVLDSSPDAEVPEFPTQNTPDLDDLFEDELDAYPDYGTDPRGDPSQ